MELELGKEKWLLVLQVILLSTAAASWISIVYQIDHRSSTSDFDVLYDKPWVRISPYLVGLAGDISRIRIYKDRRPYAIKNQRRAGSLWHKRAGASNRDIEVDQSGHNLNHSQTLSQE